MPRAFLFASLLLLAGCTDRSDELTSGDGNFNTASALQYDQLAARLDQLEQANAALEQRIAQLEGKMNQ